MLAGDGGDLVGDGDDGVEALLTGDIEVVLQLFCGELVAACLDLDERGPVAGTAADADEAIRVQLLVTEEKRDLDVGLDCPGRGAVRLEQRPAT